MCKATKKIKKIISQYEKPTLDKSMNVFELNAKYDEYVHALKIEKPEKAYMLLKDFIFEDQENFGVLFLNRGNVVVGIHEITCGLVNQTPVHPREAFREAIKKNAVSVMFFHNHPSGTKMPSQDDISLTRVLVAAGQILQIPVLDHLIVAKGGFTSILRENPEIFKVSS